MRNFVNKQGVFLKNWAVYMQTKIKSDFKEYCKNNWFCLLLGIFCYLFLSLTLWSSWDSAYFFVMDSLIWRLIYYLLASRTDSPYPLALPTGIWLFLATYSPAAMLVCFWVVPPLAFWDPGSAWFGFWVDLEGSSLRALLSCSWWAGLFWVGLTAATEWSSYISMTFVLTLWNSSD